MAEPFKNVFDPACVAWFAHQLTAAGFDGAAFQRAVLASLEELELKDRVRLLADALHDHLSGDYQRDLEVLLGLMGPPADRSQADPFAFRMWPITMFVQRRGLAHPEASLAALHALTQRFTGEFAIRPFILRHPELTLAALRSWVTDDSLHVRRLVSEGTRTRLPWGERLQPFIDDPRPVLELLEQLRADPEEVVRRSVANNLNDLAKDHPDLVVDLCQRWSAEVPGPDTRRLVARALRTLVKRGYAPAMRVMGVDPHAPVELSDLQASDRVVLGDSLEVSVTVRNAGTTPIDVLLDLVLHLRKANGGTSPKVFKWTRFALAPGQARPVSKRLPLRPVTTRRHYPGQHRVDVQANGVVRCGADFELVMR